MTMEGGGRVEAIRWTGQRLELLDQRLLPEEETYLPLENAPSVADAIRDLVVRGAPAIGITAAYGVVLSARIHGSNRQAIDQDLSILAESRPTAVNLFWALNRMRELLDAGADVERLEQEARQIQSDDVEANQRMGGHGAEVLGPDSTILTHCNAGALATGGYGTALGVIRSAHAAGKLRKVYAGETRPWMQGARLTAWELLRDAIPVTLVLEGAVAPLFRSGAVDWLVVGADRIVANGDVANKIGTYSAALHARHHGARVMVAAPNSTVDLSIPSGDQIPIENRSPDEVLRYAGSAVAASGAEAWNPVFDVTPHELVDCIVTENGVARAPFEDSLRQLVLGTGQPDFTK